MLNFSFYTFLSRPLGIFYIGSSYKDSTVYPASSFIFLRKNHAGSWPPFVLARPLPDLPTVFPPLCVFHLSYPPSAVRHLCPAGTQQRLLLRRPPRLRQHRVRTHSLPNPTTLQSQQQIPSAITFSALWICYSTFFIFSSLPLHLSPSFPMSHFGKMSGLALSFAALALLLQLPFLHLIKHQLHGDPLYVSGQRFCDKFSIKTYCAI